MNLITLQRVLLASVVFFASSVVAIPTLKADKPSSAVRFTSASLEGLYAYTNNTDNVASYGLLVFDGIGHVTSPEIRVNKPDGSGDRTVVSARVNRRV